MSTIYRFEWNGIGVYQARRDNDYIYDILENYNCGSSLNNPSPSEDGGFKPHINKLGKDDFIFGFTSPRMLLNWFCLDCVEELLDIAGVTLQVIKINSDHVFASDKQCIFMKSAIIEKIEVNSFEEAKSFLGIDSV